MNCYMLQAYKAATNSPDMSSQNGAVIVSSIQVIGEGCNKPVPGILPIQERPAKYKVFEHAERYAILTAWGKLSGSVMYCPWAACCDCARAIILSGIMSVVVHNERMLLTPDHWKDDVELALRMLDRNNVTILYHHGPVPGAPSILVNGSMWSPEICEFL